MVRAKIGRCGQLIANALIQVKGIGFNSAMGRKAAVGCKLDRCPVCPLPADMTCSKRLSGMGPCTAAEPYSITSSARISNEVGTVRPSALAVFTLIMRTNFVGLCTGRSTGLAPLRILST